MSFSIKDQIAIVTGANRGIGKTITETFLNQGAAKVYAAVRNVDSAQSLVEQYPGKVIPVELDLTKPETIQSAAEAAADVTLVVNNAGILHTYPILCEEAVGSLRSIMETNVYGLMHVALAFAPVLKANGGGAFVQINSVASLQTTPLFATYCASKAAAYSVTQALRMELGEQGTQVLSVHPGPIDTDMASSADLPFETEPPEVVAETILDCLASGAFHAYPDALAKAVGEHYQKYAERAIER